MASLHTPTCADLESVLATLDRFVKANGPEISWLANRFGEALGISPTVRMTPRARRVLRTVAAFSADASMRLGQSEIRQLLRAFYRHDRRRADLVSAFVSTPLVAAHCDAVCGHLLTDRDAAEPRPLDVDAIYWISDEGMLEPFGAGAFDVLGWRVEVGDARWFVAIATLSPVGVDRVDEAARKRALPPAETPTGPGAHDALWRGLVDTLVTSALEPVPRVHPSPGRRGVLVDPPHHLRRAVRYWTCLGLERLPLDAALPSFVRPRQLRALSRQRSVRWMLAGALTPDDTLTALRPLFEQLRFGLLPPVAREMAHDLADPRLDAWMALDELPAAFGFRLDDDGVLPGCGEADLQALPLRMLELGPDAALWDDLPDTARIQSALRWAEARPEHPESADLVDTFRQVRAEQRWLASWGASGPPLDRPEVYVELVDAACQRFAPRGAGESPADTPLEALGLGGGNLGRLARGLGLTEPTIGDLPMHHTALSALSGVGPSTVEALTRALFDHLRTWRPVGPRPVPAPAANDDDRARPEAEHGRGAALALARATASLGDGLDELDRLFSTA